MLLIMTFNSYYKNWLSGLKKQDQLKLIMQILLFSLVLIIFVVLLAQKINLSAVDLGRHIKNGELILNGNWEIFNTNYYSYTHGDYLFINHHWLSGIVFYLLNLLGGMTLVSLFFVAN
ncbi:MAG: hypothetical protein CO133_00360, partial [Candidatus Komeilibacteria bacterium CG_4_9_14_3_um_filter_37_5]